MSTSSGSRVGVRMEADAVWEGGGGGEGIGWGGEGRRVKDRSLKPRHTTARLRRKVRASIGL